MVFDLACFTWNRIYTLLTKCIWGNVRHVTSFIRGSYIIVLLKSSQHTRSYCYGLFINEWQHHFWFWVRKRSLECEKKKILPQLENLLDFAIFSILSYQYDIIRYILIFFLFLFFQNSLHNFSKFSP